MEAGKNEITDPCIPRQEYQAQNVMDIRFGMKLEYGEFHALFTGDVTEDGEWQWLGHYHQTGNIITIRWRIMVHDTLILSFC